MRIRTALLAAPALAILLAAPIARADWHGPRPEWHAPRAEWHDHDGRHGWGWPYHRPGPVDYHHGYRYGGPGPAIAGALLGLGVGAVIAGTLAPPVYAPPPVVYAAPPPVVYAPPPAPALAW